MSTDITRNSFDAAMFFTRVIKQQGRLDLDADFNEQGDILLNLHRIFVRELLGPFCAVGDAFRISEEGDLPPDLRIETGSCYVDGIWVHAPPSLAPLRYLHQPIPDADANLAWPDGDYIVFLDVYEREVTAVEEASLLDPGLGGVDTAARSQVAWQVKVRPVPANAASITALTYDATGEANQAWERIIRQELAPNASPSLPAAQLAARVRYPAAASDASMDADLHSRHSGQSNCLYRIEIHDGGDQTTATFKWSRNNASGLWRAKLMNDPLTFKLLPGSSDREKPIRTGDWLEVVPLPWIPGSRQNRLLRVSDVDKDHSRIVFGGITSVYLPQGEVLIRKWDHSFTKVAAIPVSASQWIVIENGLQIRFEPDCCYRSGEYWQIPARHGVNNIIWPQNGGSVATVPATGGQHHYVPLAIISRRNNAVTWIRSTRRVLSREQLVKVE